MERIDETRLRKVLETELSAGSHARVLKALGLRGPMREVETTVEVRAWLRDACQESVQMGLSVPKEIEALLDAPQRKKES